MLVTISALLFSIVRDYSTHADTESIVVKVQKQIKIGILSSLGYQARGGFSGARNFFHISETLTAQIRRELDLTRLLLLSNDNFNCPLMCQKPV